MSTTPSPEQLELLKQARHGSLLKIWASGRRRLTAEEHAEIAHLISAESEKEPPIPIPIPRKVKYAKKLEAYEGLYGTKIRAIKRWIAIGKEQTPHDLPPLDDPANMPEWWERRMTHRIPDAINAAAAQSLKDAPRSTANAPSQPPTVNRPLDTGAPATPGTSRDFSDLATLDLPAAVEQLRHSLAVNHKLLQEALQGIDGQGKAGVPDEGLIRARQNAYKQIFDLLRKSENDLLEWQQSHGNLASRDEVRAENNRIASAIFQAVMRLAKNTRPQLSGKTTAEQDQIWEKETLACFAALKSAKFTVLDHALTV